MTFSLPKLPYAKDALAPHMSEETLDYHHGKHHQAYVDKANELAAKAGLEGESLLNVIRKAKDKGDKKLFNNAAQHWNHSFFWQGLAPEGSTERSADLDAMIARDFGDLDTMLEKLASEAKDHFASGWAWLVLDNGKLKVTSLHDGDTPAVHDFKPLFTLDVWEHAYYVDYRNERPKYVKTVLEKLINWEFVAQNLDGKGLDRADQGAKETTTA